VITAVRLVDGARELTLHPRVDVLPDSLDVSFPAIREVTEPRVDDDGERDTTDLFGARAVSLSAALTDDTYAPANLLDQVKAFLHPRTRPYLYVTQDGWGQERRMLLRIDQFSEPYSGYVASQVRAVQLQWKAPDGIWEAADTETVVVNADIGSTDGISFPISFPLAWPTTTASGATTVSNLGGVPSHFVARLYGPCTGPRLVNETTGEETTFTAALVLAAGEYVEVDTRNRTAYLNSEAGQSRLNYLDFTVTSWWRIEPGDQQIRYAPETASPGSVAEITYRPAWL
jgi:hypothetical protein